MAPPHEAHVFLHIMGLTRMPADSTREKRRAVSSLSGALYFYSTFSVSSLFT